MTSCVSCTIETHKYKCPKCAAFYCSVACYKAHKEDLCQPKDTVGSHKIQDETAHTEEPALHNPFSTDDAVQDHKLAELANSAELRKLLSNHHLRNLLRDIDVARNARATICAAMHEPLFVEFADACLQVLEPHEEH